MKFWKITKSIILFLILLTLTLAKLSAEKKVLQTADLLINQGPAQYSSLDLSLILLGLSRAHNLSDISEKEKLTWSNFIQTTSPSLLKNLPLSLDIENLITISNLIETHLYHPIPELKDKLYQFRKWALSPRFIGPENDLGRLALIHILLNSDPDEDTLGYCRNLLEATLEMSRYENEMHIFNLPGDLQSLAHLLLSRIIKSRLGVLDQRKLKWFWLTNYKYLTRKLTSQAQDEFILAEALLQHGLLHHAWVQGEKILNLDPPPEELPKYFSVSTLYLVEKKKEEAWIRLAKSRPSPRWITTEEEWKQIIERNKKESYYMELKKVIQQAEEVLNSDIASYYEPAPSLNERGKTNELATAVGRKMNFLKTAFLATGENKWGQAYKEIVMAQIKQYLDYGDFRCYYNLNVPGPWDGLNAVINFTAAFDLLAGKELLNEEEKERIIRTIREIGYELEWTITYSNLIVHNAWARWIGSLGFLTAYWLDFPENEKWSDLVMKKLPFLYKGILGDGGWWERTINYHLFTLDLLEVWGSALMKLHGQNLFQQTINERSLLMMLDWLIKITPPTGEIPLFNDGQKLNLRDNKTAINMALTLKKGDFFKSINFVPKGSINELAIPEIEWRQPDFNSILLEDSGYGIFRSGWDIDDLYFAMKFGEHGGGHGHFDKGSIYLQVYGRPWLIDPGYGQRETYKHNTVVVDRSDQKEAAGQLLRWYTGEVIELISIKHRAYRNVEHYRTAVFLKPDSILIIDRLIPSDKKSHTYDWLLQFNSDNCQSEPLGWTSRFQNLGLKIIFPENDRQGNRLLGPALNVNTLPSNYQRMGNENLYLEIYRGKWTKETSGPAVFVALLKPFKNSEPKVVLRQKLIDRNLIVGIKEDGQTTVLEQSEDGKVKYRISGHKEFSIIPHQKPIKN